MILPDKVYNILKWVLMTFVPALIVLISTLGVIYNFDTEVVTLTIGAIATFAATIVGISNYNYNKGDK